MDLTDVLRDVSKAASLVDHEWYVEGILNPGKPTFDPAAEGIKKRNNVKPELEVEWGMAGPQIDLDEPAGVVERNIPVENLENITDKVIMFARDQQNKGKMGKMLVKALRANFDQGTLKIAKSALRKQFALDGIVGCIAVDGRGYKSCQDALKAASNSPYKHFIKHVIGCQCGDPHMLPQVATASLKKLSEEVTGNATDDFFASSDHKVAMTSHCRSTMLPILSWRGDLDPSEMDSTMLDIQNTTGLPEGETDKLWDDRKNNKYSSNLEFIRAAFREVEAYKGKKEAIDYSKKADISDFMIQPSDNEIDFSTPIQPDLDLIPEQPELDVVEGEEFMPQDVEMEQFMEPEFEGIDEVPVDDVMPPINTLDMQMFSNPDDEDLGVF